jgi:outer membrane cobalamin receptor
MQHASHVGAAAAFAAVLMLALPAGATAQAVSEATIDTVHVEAASRIAGAAARGRAVEVIDRAELIAIGARTVGEALARATGVDLMARSPASADVSIRGSSFEQVLVMVDGVRMNDAQTGHFHLDLAVPLEQIERIEVVRGAGSAVHGADAVGGVINIVTRDDTRGWSGRAEAGTFGAVAVSGAAAGSTGAARFDAGAELRSGDGHREGTDYRIAQLRAAAALPLAGRTLRAEAAAADRAFGADHFYAPFPSFEETRTLTASVGLRGDRGDAGLEPRLMVRRHNDDFILVREDPSIYRNLHTTLQVGGEVIGRAAPGGLPVVLGVEGYGDRIASETLGDRSEERAAAFGEVAWEGDRVDLSLGGRLDWHSAFGTAVTPSLAASWSAAPALRLRASAGGGFRTPSWTDRYYADPANVGSPDLQPERTWTTEVGIDVGTGMARVGATLFQRDARDLIDWVRPAADEGAVWETRNVAEARFRGVEVQGQAAGPASTTWILRGSWLSVDAEEGAGLESKYALRPLTEEASLEARLPVGGALDLRATGHARQRAGEERHHLLDAGARWRARRGMAVSLDLHNLTDERYVDIVGQPAPGRSVRLGVEVTGR